MTKDEYIDRIKDLSKNLKSISQWSDGSVFGHIKNSDQTDYVYEFYFYIYLIKCISNKHDLVFVPGSKSFPKKPANKAGSPKFVVLDGSRKRLVEVCAGVKIQSSVIKSYNVAPDVSFQLPDSGDEPTQKDVLQIFDCKYHADPDESIQISTFRDFSKIIIDLKIEDGAVISTGINSSCEFLYNAIITNVSKKTIHEDYLSHFKFKCIYAFNGNESYDIAG